MACRKVRVYQHNDRNKVAPDCNMHCQAAIDIKIKKDNRNMRRNNPFLWREVPLQAVIKLVAEPNYSNKSADALWRLRSSKDIHAAFQKYFESVKTPWDLICCHQEQLFVKLDGIAALANKPSLRYNCITTEAPYSILYQNRVQLYHYYAINENKRVTDEDATSIWSWKLHSRQGIYAVFFYDFVNLHS